MHRAKLKAGTLISGIKQGRHCHFRLSGIDITEMLEKMMGVAARAGHLRARPGASDPVIVKRVPVMIILWVNGHGNV